MAINKVEICGVDTGKLPRISYKKSTELLERIKSGDESARDEFIQANLRLVLSVIQRFANRGENPDDLFQVGCIGLIKAIDNFDMSLDVRFSTYACPMIIGEVRRHLRDNNPVRVSRSLRDTAYHAMQVRERLMNELERDPTPEEIAKELGIDREEVVIALDAIVEPLSLNEPVYSDGGDTIYVMDQIGDRESEESWLDEILLRQAIEELNPREKKILFLRFMQGKTQMEVAGEIGISQAQVSRLEKGAIKKIKDKNKA